MKKRIAIRVVVGSAIAVALAVGAYIVRRRAASIAEWSESHPDTFEARRICEAHLRRLSWVLHADSFENADKKVESVEELAKRIGSRDLESLAALRCPVDTSAGVTSYELVKEVAQGDEPSPQARVILRERRANHEGSRAIVYGDGHVEWVDEVGGSRR